jgi:hypothetical protein
MSSPVLVRASGANKLALGGISVIELKAGE